jgi:uncharacterized protein YndB with AHSA1/START domain
MRIEQTIEIASPPERVFAVLSDPAKLPHWQTSAVEVRRAAEGRLRVGERFQEVHAAFGRRVESTVEVREYEPPSTLALDVVDGPLPLDGRWPLEPRDGGTCLHFRGEARLHGLLRAATPPRQARTRPPVRPPPSPLEATPGNRAQLLTRPVAAGGVTREWGRHPMSAGSACRDTRSA